MPIRRLKSSHALVVQMQLSRAGMDVTGLLQNPSSTLRMAGPWWAIAGSASVLVSGLLWAVAYERTRSLLPGLFAHAVNNLLSTLWTVGLLR